MPGSAPYCRTRIFVEQAIRDRLAARGIDVPLVGDFHYIGHKLLKDYPTLQEMGLKNFNLTIWHGLYAPKGTPAPILKTLNEGLKKALKDADFIKKNEGMGAVVVTDKRVEPEEHKKFVAAEIIKLKAAVDAAKQYAD